MRFLGALASSAGEVRPSGLSAGARPALAHASVNRAKRGCSSAAVGRALKSPTRTFAPGSGRVDRLGDDGRLEQPVGRGRVQVRVVELQRHAVHVDHRERQAALLVLAGARQRRGAAGADRKAAQDQGSVLVRPVGVDIRRMIQVRRVAAVLHPEGRRQHGRFVLVAAARPEPVDLLQADDVGLVFADHSDRRLQVQIAVGRRRLSRRRRRLRARRVGLTVLDVVGHHAKIAWLRGRRRGD